MGIRGVFCICMLFLAHIHTIPLPCNEFFTTTRCVCEESYIIVFFLSFFFATSKKRPFLWPTAFFNQIASFWLPIAPSRPVLEYTCNLNFHSVILIHEATILGRGVRICLCGRTESIHVVLPVHLILLQGPSEGLSTLSDGMEIVLVTLLARAAVHRAARGGALLGRCGLLLLLLGHHQLSFGLVENGLDDGLLLCRQVGC